MIFHVVLHQIFVRKKERWLVSELILGHCSGENNLFAWCLFAVTCPFLPFPKPSLFSLSFFVYLYAFALHITLNNICLYWWKRFNKVNKCVSILAVLNQNMWICYFSALYCSMSSKVTFSIAEIKEDLFWFPL